MSKEAKPYLVSEEVKVNDLVSGEAWICLESEEVRRFLVYKELQLFLVLKEARLRLMSEEAKLC